MTKKKVAEEKGVAQTRQTQAETEWEAACFLLYASIKNMNSPFFFKKCHLMLSLALEQPGSIAELALLQPGASVRSSDKAHLDCPSYK